MRLRNITTYREEKYRPIAYLCSWYLNHWISQKLLLP